MSQPQSRRGKWAGSPEVSLPTAVKVQFSRPSGKCHGEVIYKATFARKSHSVPKSHQQKQRTPLQETALGINSGRITFRKARWSQSQGR